MSTQAAKQGFCTECNMMHSVHFQGDPDLKSPDDPENYVVGWHMDGTSVCDGFNKPPSRLYFPQGASAPREKEPNFEQFELGRDGEYRTTSGDDGWGDHDRTGM